MLRFFKLLFIAGGLLSLNACFFAGPKNSGKVKSYAPGVIRTQKGFYRVGELNPGWKLVKIDHYRVISFRNAALESTLSTSAFCDDTFEDSSLEVLSRHLQWGLTEIKILSEKTFALNHRQALRTVVQGKMDGVPIKLDTVVIKKDYCVFDFSLVTKPSFYQPASLDFETFFRGFEFQGEI